MSSVQNFIDHGRVGAELLFKRNFTIPYAQNDKNRYEVEVEVRICKNIILGLINESPNEDFSDLRKILKIWSRWHCSEYNPGSDKQKAAIEKFEANFGKDLKYEEACEFLKLIDLYEDRGYRYGESWLYEKVPNEVIEEAANLFEGFEVK